MHRFAGTLAVSLALVLALGASGCSNAGLIAKVNGEGIKREDFDREIERYRTQYPTMFQNQDSEFRFRRTLLDQMVDAVLLRQAAKREGVSVGDEDVDKQIENLKRGFADQAAFESALEKSGYTVDQFREFTRDQLTSQQLIGKVASGIEVSDDEVKAQYDGNKEKYVRQAHEMYHASHILFDSKDEKTAREVRDRIVDGEDFGKLAKEYSKDTVSAARGGDLGWASTPYVQEFQTVAEKLPVGEISQLVKSTFGWHIIKILERKSDKQKSFDEVKEQIRQILFQQKQAQAYQNYLQKLRADAKIEVFDDELESAASPVPTETAPSK